MTLKVKTGKSGCGRAAGILSVAIGAAVATGALAYAPAPVVFDTPAADYRRRYAPHHPSGVRHFYAPHVHEFASRLANAVAVGDHKAVLKMDSERARLALKKKPLESLKPTLPRTEENFRMVLRKILAVTS